jgi:hypothetical protein
MRFFLVSLSARPSMLSFMRILANIRKQLRANGLDSPSVNRKRSHSS